MRRPLLAVGYALALAGIVAGALRLADVVVGKRLSLATNFAPGIDKLTIRTLELFPYDGFHVQANFRHRGPMPWNEHTPEADFDVRSGDKGFFVDFSLDDPPPKAADEVRIVLVGGSGAQGWGGTRNDRMFSAVLERELNRAFAGRGPRVRVVNLAMGSSLAYQNFVALNLWGHALEPDLILAYVGRNDFFVPLWHEGGSDGYYRFDEVYTLALAARESARPQRLPWIADLLPNIMRRTDLGLGLRIALGLDRLGESSLDGYLQARGLELIDRRQALERRATPLLIHALQSIKRDFGGIPILVAWQPIGYERDYLRGELGEDFYERMFERVVRELAGYRDDRWHFVNFQRTGAEVPPRGFESHLDDPSHAIVGRILADRIEPLVPGLIAGRSGRGTRP